MHIFNRTNNELFKEGMNSSAKPLVDINVEAQLVQMYIVRKKTKFRKVVYQHVAFC